MLSTSGSGGLSWFHFDDVVKIYAYKCTHVHVSYNRLYTCLFQSIIICFIVYCCPILLWSSSSSFSCHSCPLFVHLSLILHPFPPLCSPLLLLHFSSYSTPSSSAPTALFLPLASPSAPNPPPPLSSPLPPSFSSSSFSSSSLIFSSSCSSSSFSFSFPPPPLLPPPVPLHPSPPPPVPPPPLPPPVPPPPSPPLSPLVYLLLSLFRLLLLFSSFSSSTSSCSSSSFFSSSPSSSTSSSSFSTRQVYAWTGIDYDVRRPSERAYRFRASTSSISPSPLPSSVSIISLWCIVPCYPPSPP